MDAIAKRALCVTCLVWSVGCENTLTTFGKADAGVTMTDKKSATKAKADAGSDVAVAGGEKGKQADASTGDDAASMKPASSGTARAGSSASSAGARAQASAAGSVARAGNNGQSATAGDNGQSAAAGDNGQSAAAGDNGQSASAGKPAASGTAGAKSSGNGRSPIDTLWDLARRTPQGRTAEVIQRYLETLDSNDGMLAESTREFLTTIDAEEDCSKGFSQECVAACQVVNAACAPCILNGDCREVLLRVCGFAALNCGNRR